jgi:hypothetical protein
MRLPLQSVIFPSGFVFLQKSTPSSREVSQYPVVKEQGRARNSLAFFYAMFLTVIVKLQIVSN